MILHNARKQLTLLRSQCTNLLAVMYTTMLQSDVWECLDLLLIRQFFNIHLELVKGDLVVIIIMINTKVLLFWGTLFISPTRYDWQYWSLRASYRLSLGVLYGFQLTSWEGEQSFHKTIHKAHGAQPDGIWGWLINCTYFLVIGVRNSDSP